LQIAAFQPLPRWISLLEFAQIMPTLRTQLFQPLPRWISRRL
jgi:hypothetical protein